MKQIRYKGYWVTVKKCPYAAKIEITVTNGRFYYIDEVPDSRIKGYPKKYVLQEMKDIVDDGVDRLNEKLYPVTGHPV